MSNVDPRTRDVPPEIADAVRRALADAGPNGAARSLGIDRTTVMAVAAGQRVMPGTLALLRESIARRNTTGPTGQLPTLQRGRGGLF